MADILWSSHAARVRPLIVVAAYSRPAALQRLLLSLNAAYYPAEGAKVLISIDGGGSKDVVDVARQFEFRHGPVEIVARTENIGLRKHILWCGDQALSYGSVIVLEDDLLVDPYFYRYACDALAAYSDEERVAGIALYSPRYNEFSGLPFEALFNGASVYFSQVPCSWGQAWSAAQWSSFRDWYSTTPEASISGIDALPLVTRGWPDSSWKKFFSAYLVCSNGLFVYPYHSYTTNCSDPGGVHIRTGTRRFQVPLGLPNRVPESLAFPSFDDGGIVYDAFLEPKPDLLEYWLGLPEASMSVDLYGTKPLALLTQRPLVLTSRPAKRALKHFPLAYRPIEANVRFPERSAPGCLVLADRRSVDFGRAGVPPAVIDYFASNQPYSVRFFARKVAASVRARLVRGLSSR